MSKSQVIGGAFSVSADRPETGGLRREMRDVRLETRAGFSIADDKRPAA